MYPERVVLVLELRRGCCQVMRGGICPCWSRWEDYAEARRADEMDVQ